MNPVSINIELAARRWGKRLRQQMEEELIRRLQDPSLEFDFSTTRNEYLFRSRWEIEWINKIRPVGIYPGVS